MNKTMKDMKKVKMYFKKLVCGELIGMIRKDIGKDVWNNDVHKRRCGMAADNDIDIDNVTAMIIIKASKQGMLDEFDCEKKTEIVQFIMGEFKDLMYKTFYEVCMDYRDVDVKRDIYEFMKLREVAIKRDYSKSFSVDDMRWRLICDTEIRFRHDLTMDSRRTEALREFIEDVAFSLFPIGDELVVRM